MDAATVLDRCARLGAVSEEPSRLLRRWGTPAMREADALVGGWMQEAGLAVEVDAVGNLIGRRGRGGPVIGSHLDTVPDAGRYDGPLGVLAGIAVAARLPDVPLVVAGFADEEGTRFGTSFLGSAAVVGAWDPAWEERLDADGVALGSLLGGDPATARWTDVPAYAEVHIEQGPALEALGAPVGVVTAITGQSHASVRFAGMAGHAGTVPMDARRDALAAAAELVLVTESLARGRDGLVATVGRIAAEPGAANVIPGAAALSLDVRHLDDGVRAAAVDALRAAAEDIAARRRLAATWSVTADEAAVPLDAERMAAAAGPDVPRLASGAGHDAAMLARIAPASMLFVRCRGGVSHHPDEHVEAADVAVALDVLARYVKGFA